LFLPDGQVDTALQTYAVATTYPMPSAHIGITVCYQNVNLFLPEAVSKKNTPIEADGISFETSAGKSKSLVPAGPFM
jgi:hypothetical protein